MYGNKFLKEMLHEINSCTFSLLSDIYLLIFDHFIPLGFSIQKCIPKNFEFYRKASVLESIKFACNFIKRRLQHRCFTVKFVKFLRAPFLHNSFLSECTTHECFFLYHLKTSENLSNIM